MRALAVVVRNLSSATGSWLKAMKKIVCSLLVLTAVWLTGCASLPSGDALKTAVTGYQLPKAPESNLALAYVVRPDLVGTAVRFNVFVDSKEDAAQVGFTRGSQYIHFNLVPGAHTIYSKAENWAELPVTVRAGEVIFIKQEVGMGLVMARNSLIRLGEDEGKYFVKTSALGTLAAPSVPLSLETWSGAFNCGAYLGRPSAVSSPEPFTVSARMTLQGNRATLIRMDDKTYRETLTGDKNSDGTLLLQGTGAFTTSQNRPWQTKLAGAFIGEGVSARYNANGTLTAFDGIVARECRLALAKD